VLGAYQQDNNNRYPISLSLLSDLTPTTSTSASKDLPRKTLLCPFDDSRGSDSQLGRPLGWGTPIELYEPGCSYSFEIGNRALGNVGGWGTIAFYSGSSHQWSEYTTWIDAKVVQLKYGNETSPRTIAGQQWGPYPANLFPVVRCFHHEAWSGAPDAVTQPKKTLNLAFDYGIFWSKPKWELDVVN
jgi:hypothetical protein